MFTHTFAKLLLLEHRLPRLVSECGHDFALRLLPFFSSTNNMWGMLLLISNFSNVVFVCKDSGEVRPGVQEIRLTSFRFFDHLQGFSTTGFAKIPHRSSTPFFRNC